MPVVGKKQNTVVRNEEGRREEGGGREGGGEGEGRREGGKEGGREGREGGEGGGRGDYFSPPVELTAVSVSVRPAVVSLCCVALSTSLAGPAK